MQHSVQGCRVGKTYDPKFQVKNARPTIDYIIGVIVKQITDYGTDLKGNMIVISKADLFNATRKHEICLARFLYCHVATKYGYTLKEIGEAINRDHTTIIHSKTAVSTFLKTQYPVFIQYYNLVTPIFGLSKV